MEEKTYTTIRKAELFKPYEYATYTTKDTVGGEIVIPVKQKSNGMYVIDYMPYTGHFSFIYRGQNTRIKPFKKTSWFDPELMMHMYVIAMFKQLEKISFRTTSQRTTENLLEMAEAIAKTRNA